MKLKINAQKMLSIMISVFIVTSISATMFAAAAENSNNPHTDINCLYHRNLKITLIFPCTIHFIFLRWMT